MAKRFSHIASLRDIAEQAGVSVSTVSKILNDSTSNVKISETTKARVTGIAEKLNYKPNYFARSLRTNRSNLISVIVWDITDPYFGEILKGIEQAVKQHDYHLTLVSANGTIDNTCCSHVMKIPTDGILVAGGPAGGIIRPDHRKMQHPLVYVGLKPAEPHAASVSVDNYMGGAIGAEHLLKKNRKTIFYITVKNRSEDEDERLNGFIDRVAAAQTDGVHVDYHVIEAASGMDGGYEAGTYIRTAADHPICVFADDLTAIGIMSACHEAGLRIPQDAAVLGYDNLPLSNFVKPRLSTLDQPRLEMGMKGGQLLIDAIMGKRELPSAEILKPSLVVRDST